MQFYDGPSTPSSSGLEPGPHPGASSGAFASRMSTLRRRDTAPELAVRKRLYAAGLRYHVCYRIPGQRRRSVDIAFLRARLAIYIDGCFWHGCPDHLHLPKANVQWWTAKIAMNKARDAAATAQLESLGWSVLRCWEHEDPDDVVDRVLSHLGRERGWPPSR